VVNKTAMRSDFVKIIVYHSEAFLSVEVPVFRFGG
jgi:hypothetical protein